ncbi:hypothetical protein Tco_0337152, partial [Tanacetum coccineum]
LGLPIAHRVVDELIEFSGETEVSKLLMKGMVELSVVLCLKYKGDGFRLCFGSSHSVARRAIDEIVEFSGETETPKYMKGLDVFLRDSRRMWNDKLLLNESIDGVEEQISTLEARLEIMDVAINSE